MSDKKQAAYPAQLQEEIQLPAMGGIVEFPTKESLGAFREETLEYTEAQHRFSLEMLRRRDDWDLFFSTYLTLDRVQHFYWRFHDAEDPTYPGPNPYESVVMDFYRLFDGYVGDYLEEIGEEGEILVISDHGHGRRCTELVNVNEHLRRTGWLEARGGGKNPLHPKRVLQRTKTLVMETLDRLDLADLTYKVVRTVPKVRELKRSDFLVDEDANLVFTPRFAGTNPCGGVSINPKQLESDGRDYEEIRSQLIEELQRIVDPKTGEAVFRWVCRREDHVGQGAMLDKFPDVLFLLKAQYGAGWDLFGNVIAPNTTHRKISGGHKVNGVLYSTLSEQGLGIPVDRVTRVEEIASLVLHAQGLGAREWMSVAGTEDVAAG